MKRLLLIPLVLFLACDDSGEDLNYEIDDLFRYPSNVGSDWEYSCVLGFDSSTFRESISFIKIINNNSVPDSCGDNVITLFKTDSIIYSSGQSLHPHIDTLNSESLPEIIPSQLDSVVSDTIFYSHSEDIFSFCSGKGMSFNGLTNPPYLQYPLSVGSTWNTQSSFNYEVIGEETILIELKDG